MVRIISMTIAFDQDATAGMAASVGSLSAALAEIGDDLPDFLSDELRGFALCGSVGGHDLSDLVVVEPADVAAGGACDVQRLKILPGNRYSEFVSAIAGRIDSHRVGVVHGWPVLSLGARTPSVTEAGSAASGPGEGCSVLDGVIQ